jgi:hypothetical protein
VIDENAMLLTILNIFRNLSFDLFNEQYLTMSTALMRHLAVCLLSSSPNVWSSGPVTEASSLALDILNNLAGKVRVSHCLQLMLVENKHFPFFCRHAKQMEFHNKRKLNPYSYHFVEDTLSFEPKTTKQLRLRLSTQTNTQSMVDYLFATETIVSTLWSCLAYCTDKSFVLRAMEVCARIASVSENVTTVFAYCPDAMLECLVEMICVNSSSVDPFSVLAHLEVADNNNSTNKSLRVSKLPASTSPFLTELIDPECRDGALEVISNLCTHSPRLQVRFASIPTLIPLLFRMVSVTGPAGGDANANNAAGANTTTVIGGIGSGGNYFLYSSNQRTDPATSRAAAILTSLASAPANAAPFLAVEDRMCVDATVDDVLAGL